MASKTNISARIVSYAGGGGGIKPSGTAYITDTSRQNVAQYAYAQIQDENLDPSIIKNGEIVLGLVGTYTEAEGNAEEMSF